MNSSASLPFRLNIARFAQVLLFLLAPVALLGAQGTGTVTGRVTSSATDAIQGAAVVVTGTSRGAITRSDGSYRIVLPAGRYELRARLLGYASSADSVTVAEGQTLTKNFMLNRAVTNLEAVAVVGTRTGERSVISAPVPIDVISSLDVQLTGRTETAQMLQAVAPSVNFPRASIGDGTDHVRPTTLRGLGPDQALVLINGKRRHTSALVNVNGFIGRGSTGVDLNAIPANMIDRIEILRDGAAAQYGSDAIGGVVNIVLKSRSPGELGVTVGQAYTTYNRADDTPYNVGALASERTARDGRVFRGAADGGLTFGANGFFHLGGELRDRGYTNRSLPDLRPQYFAGDARETNPAYPVEDRITHRQGDAYTHDVIGFYNAGTTFANGLELYSFGGASHRRGEAPGFFRRPLDDRTVRALYPNGFLPMINSNVNDVAGTLGVKGTVAGWNWDLSTVGGGNKFTFLIKDSENASQGATSQTQFDAGALKYSQSTSNLDFARELRWLGERALRAAAGAEFRWEQYGIEAGEPASYANGGQFVRDAAGNATTRPAAPFSQVFPGFNPTQATTHTRNNVGAYIDLESDLTPMLLLGVAGRYERYNDFGSTTNGKVTGRFEPVHGIAFRGAASTGFRAPSLGQSYFQSTATNFINGVPFEIRTLPVDNPQARLLGARDLKPEKSRNYSAGVALEPLRSLSLTVDWYRIDIKDRIVFSENFTGTAITNFFTAQGFPGVTGARYFTNAVDTRTNGVDIIANYGMSLAQTNVLRLTAAYNHNVNKITRVTQTPNQTVDPNLVLFGRVERARTEIGQPKDNLILTADYDAKWWSLVARGQRFGEVTSFGTAGPPAGQTRGPLDQTFSPKWVTDINGSLKLLRRYTLTVGADNVFDVYPDRNSVVGTPLTAGTSGNSNFGIFPYNGISPFGFNGRFIYTKLTASF